MKIALFGNSITKGDEKIKYEIIEKIAKNNGEVYILNTLFNSFTEDTKKSINLLQCNVFDKVPKVDIAFSLGGDGTFLRTSALIGRLGIPIIGINLGRLGYLADINYNDFDETLNDIISGNYTIEERTVLQMETNPKQESFEESLFALNEVAVLKQDTSSMITLHAYINNQYLTSYMADGLLISTPTGSTAYSLSIGGSVMEPSTPNIMLSAIAPHSLNTRPLIINDDSVISLKIESRSNHFLVSLDGISQIFKDNVELTIKKTDFKIKIAKRKGQTFFKTLHDKLMWGADIRPL